MKTKLKPVIIQEIWIITGFVLVTNRLVFLALLTVTITVSEVDDEANHEPNGEDHPSHGLQLRHQEHA